MKKLFLLIFAVIAVASVAMADTCPSCHGSGQRKTRFNVGVGGLSNEKMKCPNCGKMIFVKGDHYDDCTTCGGTGHVRDRMPKHDDDDYDPNADIYMKYLDAAEYANWKQCIVTAMQGTYEGVTCQRCNGDGRCRLCNGTGYMPQQLQHPDDAMLGIGATPCSMCGATGNCMDCNGNKVIYQYTDKGKAEANQMLEKYRDLVYARMNAAENNNNINGGGGMEVTPEGTDDGGVNRLKEMLERSKESSSDDKDALYGFIVVVAVVVLWLVLRKKKKNTNQQ